MTENRKRTVAILGGGIGGLSAAHELIERGFDVEIYERRDVPGGKARSFYHRPPDEPDAGSWPHGLPAEHGFRFFPGFYRHVTDTMRRIPFFDHGTPVFDNLVETTEFALARYDAAPIKLPTRMPGSLRQLQRDLERYLHEELPVFEPGELEFYAERIWQILTSSQERRNDEYERTGWWDYIGAEQRSLTYRKYLGNLSRTLVAANPRRVSTRTNGNTFVQMLLDVGRSGSQVDRVLNGPTNEVWIHPWLQYLLGRGCRYYLNTQVESIEIDTDGGIGAVTIRPIDYKDARPPYEGMTRAVRVIECDRYGVTRSEAIGQEGSFRIQADYFISAMPVEAMAELLSDEVLAADPTLATLPRLAESTRWMNGLLFYLGRNVNIVHGHTIFVDPAWALTSISQRQFWTADGFDTYADGKVEGILSIDISNWVEADPDLTLVGELLACNCTASQIKDFAWEYVKRSLNHGDSALQDTDRIHAVIDPAIVEMLHILRERGTTLEAARKDLVLDETWRDLYQRKQKNLEPLLVNEVNTWGLRPDAYTRIPNLFLASDYVRTHTDLATMEAANEAARRAVNALLDAAGSRAPKCRVWKLREPWLFGIYRWLDRRRYAKGLPWRGKLPWPLRLLQWLWQWIFGATDAVRRFALDRRPQPGKKTH